MRDGHRGASLNCCIGRGQLFSHPFLGKRRNVLVLNAVWPAHAGPHTRGFDAGAKSDTAVFAGIIPFRRRPDLS
jgi:hypothetical protein